MIPTKRVSEVLLGLAAAVTLTGSVVAIDDAPARGAAATASQSRSIVGAWTTRVRPRNCLTGEITPGPGLRGLFTFHEGGTLSEFGVPPGSTPALRSPGHGRWDREPGWENYSFAFTYYRYDGTGLFIGSQKVSSVVVLDATGDAFEAISTIEFLDAGDNVTMTVCGAAAGTRFE